LRHCIHGASERISIDLKMMEIAGTKQSKTKSPQDWRKKSYYRPRRPRRIFSKKPIYSGARKKLPFNLFKVVLTLVDPNSGDFQKAMNTQMKFIFPLMIGWFSYTLPVGLSLYWNIFSLFSIMQYKKLKVKN